MKRGYICRVADTNEERRLKLPRAEFFIVMKKIDGCEVLAVPVGNDCRKDSMAVHIGGRKYWVRVTALIKLPEELLKGIPWMKLDNPYQTVSEIYEKRRSILKEKWSMKRKKKQEERRLLRWLERERQERERMETPMEEINVPKYLADNVRHPYLGGLVSSR